MQLSAAYDRLRMEQTQAIEIHDSTLGSVSSRVNDVLLNFTKVYIHRSEGTPGIDAGSGWVQKACLCIADATITQSLSALPVELLNGHVKCGEVIIKMIPLPFDCSGPVEVRLETWNDGVLHVMGKSARLELIGEPKYVEQFPPRKR